MVENEPGQACLVLLLPRIFACFVVLPLLLQNNFGWSWEKIRVILMHYKKNSARKFKVVCKTLFPDYTLTLWLSCKNCTLILVQIGLTVVFSLFHFEVWVHKIYCWLTKQLKAIAQNTPVSGRTAMRWLEKWDNLKQSRLRRNPSWHEDVKSWLLENSSTSKWELTRK